MQAVSDRSLGLLEKTSSFCRRLACFATNQRFPVDPKLWHLHLKDAVSLAIRKEAIISFFIFPVRSSSKYFQ
jgi:hypothetical protein